LTTRGGTTPTPSHMNASYHTYEKTSLFRRKKQRAIEVGEIKEKLEKGELTYM